jgi:hypothetical protein
MATHDSVRVEFESTRVQPLDTYPESRVTAEAARRTPMRIAIIGAGNVGGTLGKMWAAKDHEVAFGVRRPNDAKVQALLATTENRARPSPIVAG